MKIFSAKTLNKTLAKEQKLRAAQWLEINGCPKVVDAAYDGYTGVKLHKFPTTKDYPYTVYPDVTQDYENLKMNMFAEVKFKMKDTFGRITVLKMFLVNSSKEAKWDSKFMVKCQGRDRKGRVQFAKYDGQIVTGNYLSNNIYGFLCAMIGIPERLSKFIARVYSKGFLEPLISGKIPDKKLLKFSDPVSDQNAISSGYRDFRIWKNKHKNM